jgi:hypothetical protein
MKYSKLISAVSVCACVAIVGCGKPAAKVAKTPDQAVMQATKALQDNQPQVLFQSLPASYQTEIKSVVSDAAGRMDEEVWNAGQDLLKSVLKVAKTKKDILLETSMLAANPKKEELSKNWDQAVEMLSAVVNSDFADLQKLRKADIEAMLAGSGSDLMKMASKFNSNDEMKQNMDKLKNTKAALVSQDGDTAKVKVSTEGEDDEVVDFVKIEGKWIPKDMADGFAEQIKTAKENLSKLDFTTKEGKAAKEMILKQIGTAKDLIAKAQEAKTKEEMDGVMMGLMMSAMSSRMGPGGAGGMPPPPSK